MVLGQVDFGCVFSGSRGRLALAALVVLGAHAVNAESRETVLAAPVLVVAPALEYRQFDSVELTGSSIISARSKEALPVLVYERKDIERMPAQTTSQLIQALTSQVNGFHLGLIGSGIAASGPEAAAIHGLQDATLVLLNGRRLPDYARPVLGIDRTATDLDVVPLQAIERVEVMNDGASARYGSDAIAGVVNIITAEQFHGARVGAQVNVPTQGGARQERAFLSMGRGDFRVDGWDWQVHAAVSRHQGLSNNERDATLRVPSVGNPADGRYYAANFYQLTRYGWPATTAPLFSSWGTVAAGTLEPQASMVDGACVTGFTPILYKGEVSCWYQRSYGLSIVPQQEREQVLASARMSLTPSWAGFVEAAWSRKTLTASVSSAYDQAWYQSLGAGRWAFTAPYPLGPNRDQYDYEQFRVTLGLKGEWSGWDAQLSYMQGAQDGLYSVAGPKVRLAGTAPFASKGLTEAELTTPLAEVTSETWSKLAEGVRLSMVPKDRGESHLESIQAMASRVLAQTDDGDVSLGTGLTWRRETLRTAHFDTSVAELYAPADSTSFPDLRAAREVSAAFGELAWPLTPFLVVNAQARFDHYSDVGSVATGKIAAQWRPHRFWSIRGSWGSGFRAPDVSQVSSQRAYASSQGSRDFYYQGNPELKPEKSTQQTIGVRFDPSPRWSLGGDVWRLHIRDQIFVPDQQFVVNHPDWASRVITPNAQGGEDFALKPFNQGESRREGIDYEFQYRYPSRWGRWRVIARGTRYLSAESRITSLDPKVSTLGIANGVNYQYVPKDKMSLSLVLERPDWSAWVRGNYLSGNREYYNVWDASAGDRTVSNDIFWRTVPSFWTLDAGWRWQPSAHANLSVKVINVLDQYPPFRALSYPLQRPGVNLNYGDYTGRTVQVQYTYQF